MGRGFLLEPYKASPKTKISETLVPTLAAKALRNLGILACAPITKK